MGFEIVYCAVCGNRLLVNDFEEGRAIRSGRGSRCVPCADKGTKRRRAVVRFPDREPSPPGPAIRPS